MSRLPAASEPGGQVALGKRERLARLVDRSGLARLLLNVRKRVRAPMLPILTYHRIAELGAGDGLDEGVIDARPEQFDEQLRLLAQHFSFVGIDDVLGFLRGGRLPPNPVMIAFDDGYRECHDVALPLLEKHGARAVFFIATDYTEHRRLFWWDRITYVLDKARRDHIELSVPRPMVFDVSSDERKHDVASALIRLVKNHYALDLDAFLDELTEQCGTPWDREAERRIVDGLLMRWDQVRALRAAGMDVQSHTRRHRVLSTLTPQMLEDELTGSRRDLEAQLGEVVRTIAYPVGYPVVEQRRVCRALMEAGYEAGFTNSTGVVHTSRPPHPFDLDRVAMDVDFSDYYFRALMAVPQFARSRAAH